jgi:DNA-binding transcriptional ArsR family regulator
MLDVTVIEDPAAAAVSLDPIRGRLLAELAAGPASAAMLAGKVGLPRQKVNYHLKALERHGLVELAGERRKGNVTERLMRATAASYVISPLALAAVQPDPDRFRDQLSARWLLAVGARLVRDVGTLITGSRGWGCSRYREGCSFVIWFETAGRRLTSSQLRDLVTKGKTRASDFAAGKGRLILDPSAPGGTRFSSS